MSETQTFECRVQCVPVPDEEGHARMRVEADSEARCQREIDALGDAAGVSAAEFSRPTRDTLTGLWVSYGWTQTSRVDDDL